MQECMCKARGCGARTVGGRDACGGTRVGGRTRDGGARPHPLPPQVRNATVVRVELRALEARVGALETERGCVLDDAEALLAGLQSVEAEAHDHAARLALLEAEVDRIAAVEARVDRLGLHLVPARLPTHPFS